MNRLATPVALCVATVRLVSLTVVTAAAPPGQVGGTSQHHEWWARYIYGEGSTVATTTNAREAASKLNPKIDSTPPRTIPPGQFAAVLKDGTRLVGHPVNHPVTIRLSFATIQLPVSKIQLVEISGNGQHLVHLTNGDRLTGTISARNVRFATKFGELVFPASVLVSLTAAETCTSPPTVVPASPTAPGTYYLRDDVQYFPTGAHFDVRVRRALEEYRSEQGAIRSLPSGTRPVR